MSRLVLLLPLLAALAPAAALADGGTRGAGRGDGVADGPQEGEGEGAGARLVAALRERGLDHIDLQLGPTQIRIEARGDGRMMSAVVDRETRAVLAHESGPSEGDAAPGIEVERVEHDFVD